MVPAKMSRQIDETVRADTKKTRTKCDRHLSIYNLKMTLSPLYSDASDIFHDEMSEGQRKCSSLLSPKGGRRHTAASSGMILSDET